MPPPRPHLLARSRSARLADRLIGKVWEKGLTPRPPLEPQALWAIGARGHGPADEHAGRSPEDVADFRQRLALLCAALREEAQLNALGHTMAYGQLTAAIRLRHRLGRLWRAQPDLPASPIAAPIIVLGQMRSGTTRMHRLLAADPAHSGTPLYRALDPVRNLLDLRPARTVAGLAVARRIIPWVDTLHPFGAARADEELAWLSHALLPPAFEAQYRIPAYLAFSEAHDPAPVYREFARILRSDAAQAGDAHRPRVLKCPQFSEDLPALLAQLPDARVVVCRRDSDQVLASTMSVVACQMACQSDHAELAAIRSEWQRKLAMRETRMNTALRQFAGPVTEVDYAALGADWMGEIARVYRELGLDLSEQALAAMRAEMGRAERSPHRHHRPGSAALA